MKKLIVLALSIGLLFSMCKKDCDPGYEGEDCDIEIRVKFYGFYVGTLTGGGQSAASQTELTVFVGDVEKIVWNQDGYLKVTGSTTFDIPNQQIPTSEGTITFEGNGSINGIQITMEFKATLSGTTVNFTFVGNKQKSAPVTNDGSLLLKIDEIISQSNRQ